MDVAVNVLPLRLYFLVYLKLEVCLSPFESFGNVDGDKVGKQQGVDTFALVFRLDGYEEEVENRWFLDKQSL